MVVRQSIAALCAVVLLSCRASEGPLPGEVWNAGALLYSGRPDPTWTVPADQAAEWVQAFDRLTRTPTPVPDQSILGYRGVWLKDPQGRRWDAWVAVVWQGNDRRSDIARALERALLQSAPPGVLPQGWDTWLATR